MDAGEFHGTHFLAMEFVEGTDLSQWVKQHGPLSVDTACRAMQQAAFGLQHAHEHGLVHRDIKPSNLLLSRSTLARRASEGSPAANERAPSLARRARVESFAIKILDLGLALNAFYKVHRKLGYGFNEKVYENSLAIELRKLGLQVAQQHEIEVFYDGQPVGTYFADLIVNEVVMLELKAVKQLADEHEAQLLNYLKATRIEVGLLLNFGSAAEMKRRVYDNDRKGSLEWIQKSDTNFTEDTEKATR